MLKTEHRINILSASMQLRMLQKQYSEGQIDLGRAILAALRDGATLREIAPVLYVSYERVRQIANLAKPKNGQNTR